MSDVLDPDLSFGYWFNVKIEVLPYAENAGVPGNAPAKLGVTYGQILPGLGADVTVAADDARSRVKELRRCQVTAEVNRPLTQQEFEDIATADELGMSLPQYVCYKYDVDHGEREPIELGAPKRESHPLTLEQELDWINLTTAYYDAELDSIQAALDEIHALPESDHAELYQINC